MIEKAPSSPKDVGEMGACVCGTCYTGTPVLHRQTCVTQGTSGSIHRVC